MSAPCQAPKRTPRSPTPTELERRLARAGDELQQARCRRHHNHEAVLAAEEALMACRLAWEEAALRVAELADIVESLQRDLDGPGARVDGGISKKLVEGTPDPTPCGHALRVGTPQPSDYAPSGAGCAGSR